MKFHINLYLFLFLLIFTSTNKADNIKNYESTDSSSLKYIREMFVKAVDSEDDTYVLENYIFEKYSNDYNNYKAIILAYYGGTVALKAKHAFDPFSKVGYVLSAAKRLTEAVTQSPANLEIRFLRFSVLSNLPSIFGYNTEMEDDKKMILTLLNHNNYSILSKKIQIGIIDFMIRSDELTSDEINKIEVIKRSLYKDE